MKDIERKAIEDYEAVAGKIVYVGIVQGYQDDASVEVRLDTPIFARIVPLDDRRIKEDVVRYTENTIIDPVYDIEVLSDHPDLKGLSSTFTYARSHFRDGGAEAGHFAVASEDMVAQHTVENGKLGLPTMKVFEVTLPGFDGDSDDTDDLVLWVAAPEASVIEAIVKDTDAKLWSEVKADPETVDLYLPSDAYTLQDKIESAAAALQSTPTP